MVVGNAAEYAPDSRVVIEWVAVLGHPVAFGQLPCSVCGIAWVNVAAAHHPP